MGAHGVAIAVITYIVPHPKIGEGKETMPHRFCHASIVRIDRGGKYVFTT
jgi:hypothetical protein